MEKFFDPIYKGCTAPSMFFGVPMLPFILGTLAFGQLSVIAFLITGLAGCITLGILYAFALSWARRVSKHDEARLLQLILKLRMRGRQAATRSYWGAVSFGPKQS